MPHKKILKVNAGFGLVEIVVAIALFAIIATGGATGILHTTSTNRFSSEKTVALQYAQEGLDAVRSIRNQGWDSPFLATNCTTGCGLSSTSGTWSYLGNSSTSEKYTRVITVENVSRNESGAIVTAGGTIDPNTKRVTSSVTWNFLGNRDDQVQLVGYLSRWDKDIRTCNWVGATTQDIYNFSTSSNAKKIAYQDGYTYVVLDDTGAAPFDFGILDVTTPTSPVEDATLNIDGNPSNVFIDGNYAYIPTSDDSAELVIVDISNSTSPVLLSSYNAAGTADGLGIYVTSGRAYIVRNGGAEDNFIVLDVTNPATPSFLGSVNIGGAGNNGYEIWVTGNYAYVASNDDAREIKAVNITNPNSPQYNGTWGYNIAGNTDATSITGSGSRVYVGATDNKIYILGIGATNPAILNFIGEYQSTAPVEDISLDASSLNLLDVTVDNATNEIEAISLANEAAPSLVDGLNLGRSAHGIASDPINCTAYIAASPNGSDQEIAVVIANGSPTPTLTPTMTPTPTSTPTITPTTTPTMTPTLTPTPGPASCSAYCQQQGSITGNCRRNNAQCSQAGGTPNSGGNQFCPAAGDPISFRVCCCF